MRRDRDCCAADSRWHRRLARGGVGHGGRVKLCAQAVTGGQPCCHGQAEDAALDALHLRAQQAARFCVNEPGGVFVARPGHGELARRVLEAGQLADLVERTLRISSRRVDIATPFVDTMLPDGQLTWVGEHERRGVGTGRYGRTVRSTAQVLRVMICSPSDTAEARDAVGRVFHDGNHARGRTRNALLQLSTQATSKLRRTRRSPIGWSAWELDWTPCRALEWLCV